MYKRQEYARYGSFDQLRENNQEQIRLLFDELGKQKAEPGSVAQKIGDLYNMGLDSVRLNQEGAAPIADELKRIQSLSGKEAVSAMIGEMHRTMSAPFFAIYVDADAKNSSMNIAGWYQAGMNMGDRDYYVSDDENSRKIRDSYTNYIKTLFTLSGYTQEAAEQAAIEFLGMNPGDNVFTARDYLTYGDILSKEKKYAEAIVQYEKAYELDNTRTDILKVLSDTYERNKDYVNAISVYEQYMAADTVNNQRVMDYYLLGQICYSAGQAAMDSIPLRDMYLIKADSMFQVVVERSPTDYRGYLCRARAAAVRDPELKEGLAKPLYEETLGILDQDATNKEKAATKRVYIEAYKYLGYYNYLQTTNPAKKNEAIAATKDYWNKMLELDPQNTEIIEALKTLDTL